MQIIKYVENILNTKLDYLFSIHKNNDEHIGNFRLGPVNTKTNTIRFGMMIGNKKNWGKGIGSQVMQFTIKKCFKDNNFDIGQLTDEQEKLYTSNLFFSSRQI